MRDSNPYLRLNTLTSAAKRFRRATAPSRKCVVWLLIVVLTGGCVKDKAPKFDPFKPVLPLDGSMLQPATPQTYVPPPLQSDAPRTLRHELPLEYWDLTLEEALQFALGHSKVMVDSGGRVLQLPAAAQTVYDPAIRESDPLGGPMAALSAFDAQLSSLAAFHEGNNFNNNLLLGGGTRFLGTSQFVADTAITKRAATGGSFRLDTNTEVFTSDAPANYFNSLNSTSFGGEIRQPLLRGAGVEFNRIAGAYQVPGAFNGVVLARMNTDISLLDFESAVRTVLIDVERAYWDLALSYRDLDAKIAARDATLETWRLIHKKLQVGMAGADEEGEARAREQYYLLQAQVENAYSGAPPVSAALGSTVGTAVLGNSAGVLGNERRLRLLIGLPPTDGRLIRPATDPARAAVSFDWRASVNDALSRRVELRRQSLMVKRREAELAATRNLRLPQLDAVAGANYRTFANNYSQIVDPAGPARANNFQNTNYNVGLNLTVPLGNRLAKTAIRNAELQVARERAVLDEQRLHVVHELSSAIVELDRAFVVMNTNYNRRAAAEQQKAAVTRKYEVGAVGLEAVLDAQRRWADAEATFHRSVFDYNRAIADVHLSRGSLLSYDGVRLADAPPEELLGDRFQLSSYLQEPEIDYAFSDAAKSQVPPTAGSPPAESSPVQIVPLPEVQSTDVAREAASEPAKVLTPTPAPMFPISDTAAGPMRILPLPPTNPSPAESVPRIMTSPNETTSPTNLPKASPTLPVISAPSRDVELRQRKSISPIFAPPAAKQPETPSPDAAPVPEIGVSRVDRPNLDITAPPVIKQPKSVAFPPPTLDETPMPVPLRSGPLFDSP